MIREKPKRNTFHYYFVPWKLFRTLKGMVIIMMNRRERFNAALSHKETDKIPLDIGGSMVSGIATVAYEKLRDKLKLPIKQIRIQNLYSMSASIDEDVLTMLEIDTRFFMDDSTRQLPEVIEKDNSLFYSDNWGFEYTRSKKSNSGF